MEQDRLREEVLDWFCGRAGDYIPNTDYQFLIEELEDILGLTREELYNAE